VKPKFINLFWDWLKNICLPSYKLAEISKMIFSKEDNITGFNCGQIGSHLILKNNESYSILKCKYCEDLVDKVKTKNEEDVVYVAKLMDYFENLDTTT
ncbi:unnamed protein product, partial [marine sediment metagenome]